MMMTNNRSFHFVYICQNESEMNGNSHDSIVTVLGMQNIFIVFKYLVCRIFEQCDLCFVRKKY